MKVVELKSKPDMFEVATALRNIADEIEAGAYDFDPTLAVVVLATETTRHDRLGVSVNFDWQTHGIGEKCGYFTAKGLLGCALTRFDLQGDI